MSASTTAKPPRIPTADRYEFHEPIGTGGMGTVYRGLDRQTGAAVAIKVLKFRPAENPTLYQRLAREFRAASDLEHPNIVRALAFENDGQFCFVVYELVEGGSLAGRIQKTGALPEAEAVRIITQIAQALHYAHQWQVVHRDVKPDNILLLPDGRAKLTDFGLAKDYAADEQDLTRHASGLGTPSFMAPEQFADAKTAGPPCDIYSLGATLYNAVTGRVPFEGKWALAILAKKEIRDYPPARALVPALSERVETAIRAALDPDLDRRPASCLEFFKLLTARRRLKGEVSRTTTPVAVGAPRHDDRRAWVRQPLGVGACGMVDTAVHGGGGWSDELWPLVVRDVSSGGMGVLLARRFERGTQLTIELSLGPAAEPRRLLVHVVRVQPDQAGHWVHGCAFDTPLGAEELAALVKFA